MADNYLEKKMEEHRMRSSVAKASPRRTAAIARPGTIALKFAPLRILVTEVTDAISEAIVTRLREAGCKVAFMCADNRRGRELSQKTGSRFYPADFKDRLCDDLHRQWGGIDMAVITGQQLPDGLDVNRIIMIGDSPRIMSSDGLTINKICPDGLTPVEVAGLCVLLSLSYATCLNGVVLGNHSSMAVAMKGEAGSPKLSNSEASAYGA